MNQTVELGIEGIDCPSCAAGIEKRLRRIGVHNPSVNVATASLTLTPAEQLPATLSVDAVVSEIENLGYHVHRRQEGVPTPDRGAAHRTLIVKTVIAVIFTVPLLLAMFLPFHLLHSPIVQLILTLPVVAIGIHHFGRSGVNSLRTGLPNMDLLILIGVLASFGYSVTALALNLGPDYIFFETAAAITALVLVGNVLEQRSMQKAGSAIEELSRVQPRNAKRLVHIDGADTIETIPVESITIGDTLRVNSGDRVPTDGDIVTGSITVDEALLTGESEPLERTVGDRLIGGSVALQGSVTMRATEIGAATVLAQIVRLVQNAQNDKPRIQRVGDLVSAYFTPLAVAIAILTFVLTVWLTEVGVGGAILRAVAVLVIACPCAMGLATPTAVMIAVGRAARSGILIRGGSTLESLARVRSVIFDKTGTLTEGKFTVRSLKTFAGVSASEARSIIKGLEQHSSHPIAYSLVTAFSGDPATTITQIRELKGSGITGIDPQGRTVTLGSGASAGAMVADPLPDADLYLVRERELLAALTIEDALRPGAAPTIEALKKLGFEPVLLSGDREKRCRYLAERVGITTVFSEKSPEAKLEVIDSLQRSGPVAFVGDGINDAPALTKSSVGIALSDATGVAIQSADIILLKGNIEKLVECLSLSRLTLRTIKQNLFWAFSYNIVAIPIAALGFLTPLIAAFAMAFSDIMTIGNSLRLRRRNL